MRIIQPVSSHSPSQRDNLLATAANAGDDAAVNAFVEVRIAYSFFTKMFDYNFSVRKRFPHHDANDDDDDNVDDGNTTANGRLYASSHPVSQPQMHRRNVLASQPERND